jgi:hypothetical protein
MIAKSRRVFTAERLHQEHRKLRNGVKFSEKSISSDVVAAYKREVMGGATTGVEPVAKEEKL